MYSTETSRPLPRFLSWLDTGAISIAAFLLLAIVAIDGLSVFYRYVLDAPFSWSEEVMRYCNIWLSYLGAISAFLHREHMKIDLAFNSTGRLGRILNIIGLLATVVVAGAMLVLGAERAIANLTQVSPSAGIVMAVPYAAVPVAGAGILIAALFFMWNALRH